MYIFFYIHPVYIDLEHSLMAFSHPLKLPSPSPLTYPYDKLDNIVLLDLSMEIQTFLFYLGNTMNSTSIFFFVNLSNKNETSAKACLSDLYVLQNDTSMIHTKKHVFQYNYSFYYSHSGMNISLIFSP